MAEAISLRLREDRSSVFFSQTDLRPSNEYDRTIRSEIQKADLFIFLVSPDSIKEGSYALTELKIAQDTWGHPKGRVLPVVIRTVPIPQLPAFLRAVSLLEPKGNITAEVAHEVAHLKGHRRRHQLRLFSAVGAVTLVIAALMSGLWISFDEDLNRSNLIEVLGPIGVRDIHLAKESDRVLTVLRENGIKTKRQLRALVKDPFIVAKLKEIYVEELERDPNAPLDGVALAVYGSYLLKNNATPEAELAVRKIIRDSAEYHRNAQTVPLPKGGFPEGTIIKGQGPTLYIIENGKKRPIPDPDTWEWMGYPKPKHVSQATLENIQTGLAIPSRRKNSEGKWVLRE